MMSLLSRLGTDLPERRYLGIDIGYKEHVAVVIDLERFVRKGGRWKRARCVHFPSTRSGLRKLQTYLDGFSTDHGTFFGLCEPTGGHYGATTFQYLLDQGYNMNLVENATRVWLIKRFGPLVNLGNVMPEDLLEVETMRLGIGVAALKPGFP